MCLAELALMDLYARGVPNTQEKTMTTKKNAKARLDETATRLVKRLGIDTLEVRYLDEHDFHSVHVANLKEVIQEAFVCGMQAARTERNIKPYIDAIS